MHLREQTLALVGHPENWPRSVQQRRAYSKQICRPSCNKHPLKVIDSHQALATEQSQDPKIRMVHCPSMKQRLESWHSSNRCSQLWMEYFISLILRDNSKRAVVPRSLQTRQLEVAHLGPFGAHFSGPHMFNAMVSSWWWEHMFHDAVQFAKACPECAITYGIGRRTKVPLHPIPVRSPFQILGIDVMDLPVTERGNRHVVVIQDLKATRIAQLLVEEVVPWFGVPEALLSNRGTNLLSHMILDICKLLGITKLNTTSYHPQCDGTVERFNRTLKQALRKHAARFGGQWDRYLPGVLWAYRNTPHTSTGEKPSFLLFGVDFSRRTRYLLQQ